MLNQIINEHIFPFLLYKRAWDTFYNQSSLVQQKVMRKILQNTKSALIVECQKDETFCIIEPEEKIEQQELI